jgi:hypothetical protein
MSEDGPDHRRVLDDTDDPHSPPTSRADQGISFVYLAESAWPNASCTLVRVPAVQGCRGWRHPDLPFGVFPARRCCRIRNISPSAHPGSGCVNTSRPAIPGPGSAWLSRRPWISTRPSPLDPGTASVLEDARMLDRARLSMAVSSVGEMRVPQKTWQAGNAATLKAWRSSPS